MVYFQQLLIVFIFTPLFGIIVVCYVVSERSFLQGRIVDEYRGRIFATYGTVITLAQTAGTLISTSLVTFTGSVFLLAAVSLIWTITGVLAFLLLPQTTNTNKTSHRSDLKTGGSSI